MKTWDMQRKTRGKTPAPEKVSDLLDELVEAYVESGEEELWNQARERIFQDICKLITDARLGVPAPPPGYQTIEKTYGSYGSARDRSRTSRKF